MPRRDPRPPMITLRAGKLSATIPVELLPALLSLAPAARQAGEALARLAARAPKDTRTRARGWFRTPSGGRHDHRRIRSPHSVQR